MCSMRILLVNPPGAVKVYDKSKIVSAVTEAPFITMGVLAASARAAGARVAVVDLMLSNSPNTVGSYSGFDCYLPCS